MFARLRRRIGLSPLAFGLLLALGLAGSAGAAATLITGKQIKDSSLTGKDVKDGSLSAKDFAKGQLPAGAKGEAGAAGPAGPAGPAGAKGDPTYTATFVVNPDGTAVEAGARLKTTVAAAVASGKRALVWIEPGDYEVTGTLSLGTQVSLAGMDLNATSISITPDESTDCGVIAPSVYGVIRDLDIYVSSVCGISLQAANASLRLHDARVTLGSGAAAISATVQLAASQQNLRADDTELSNQGSGTGAAVVLAQASSAGVRLHGGSVDLSTGGASSAGIVLTGTSGRLQTAGTLLTAKELVVALGSSSTMTSRDSFFISQQNAVITTTTTVANSSILYGGTVESPAVTAIDQGTPNTVKCPGVLDINGTVGSPATSTCP